MNKKSLFFCLLILFIGYTHLDAINKKKPNVIIVLTDDQGYGEIAAHGNPHIQTPNMDQLHNEGIRLNNFHVNAVCSPSRAALLTGRYASRTGVWHTLGSRNIMWQEEKTMADFFKSNGYTTMMSGKWHLGDNHPYRPEDKGFDKVFRIGGGSLGQIADYWGNQLWDAHYWNGTEWQLSEGYCTDVQFNAVFDFIRENKDKPFFTYLATTAPHSPIGADDKYVRPYLQMGLKENVAKFYAMVTNIDENLGKLRQLLTKLNIANNTILIFASDNGSACDKQGQSYNGGMRGHKGSCYEGGHRVPCFIYWPNGHLTGGLTVSEVTAHIDILPTLMDACNLNNTYNVVFDGINLIPHINAPASKWPKRTIVTETKVNSREKLYKSSVVIDDEWRFIQGDELYNLSDDPAQHTNIAATNLILTDELKKSYNRWFQSVSARFNEKQHIPVGYNHEELILTAMDVFPLDESTSAKTVWNQKGVAKGQINHGTWAIDVREDGMYTFKLYRWAPELDLAFNKTVPKGKKVIFTEAGVRINGQSVQKTIKGSEKFILFSIELRKGKYALDAYLKTSKDEFTSAYYVGIHNDTPSKQEEQ